MWSCARNAAALRIARLLNKGAYLHQKSTRINGVDVKAWPTGGAKTRGMLRKRSTRHRASA